MEHQSPLLLEQMKRCDEIFDKETSDEMKCEQRTRHILESLQNTVFITASAGTKGFVPSSKGSNHSKGNEKVKGSSDLPLVEDET